MELSHLFVPSVIVITLLWRRKVHHLFANRINSLAFYLHKNDINKVALFFYQVAHYLKRKDYVILNNIGCVLRDIGKPKKAIRYLEKSIQLKPGYVHATNMLGNIYIESGDMARGIVLLEENTKRFPDYGISYYTLAEYYCNLGEFELSRNYLVGYFACLRKTGSDGSMDESLQNKAKVLQYYLTNESSSDHYETESDL